MAYGVTFPDALPSDVLTTLAIDVLLCAQT
jgi:hypothetical protein